MTGVTVWHSLSCRERGRCAAHDSGGDMHKAGGVFISLTVVWGRYLSWVQFGVPPGGGEGWHLGGPVKHRAAPRTLGASGRSPSLSCMGSLGSWRTVRVSPLLGLDEGVWAACYP